MGLVRFWLPAVLAALPSMALAQSGFVSPDGKSRYPAVTIFCPNGTQVAPCNFGGPGALSLNFQGAAVSASNSLPVTDEALTALIFGGALKTTLSGTPTVSLAGGTNALGSVTVSNFPSSQPVTVTSLPPLPAGSNALGSVGLSAGSMGSVTAGGTAGNLAQAVQGIAGGVPQPVSGTFWQTTQPVSAASWPLPAGAATAANQTAAQSAPGTAASTALTVQGSSGGVALPVSGSFWQATQPVSAASLPLPAGAATSANQTATQSAPGTAASAAFTVQGASGGVALPVTGTFWPTTQPVSATSLPLPSGAATSTSNAPVTPGTATATNSTLIGCQYNSTQASFTTGQQGQVSCDSGGRLFVTSNTNLPTYLQAVTAGGASMGAYVNAASSCMATLVKSSAGMVFGYAISNSNSSGVWVRLFSASTAPTCGAGTPVRRLYVPAGATITQALDLGWVFGTGIGFDVTSGGGADADSTTVTAASSVLVNIDYK